MSAPTTPNTAHNAKITPHYEHREQQPAQFGATPEFPASSISVAVCSPKTLQTANDPSIARTRP